MADRYQNRQYPADDYGRGGDQHGPARTEEDPLAELARLIGQTDPFSPLGRTNAKAPPQSAPEPYEPAVENDDEPPAPPPGPPSWMRRANVQAQPSMPPRQEFPRQAPPVHPLHRYPQPAEPEEEHQQYAAYPEPTTEDQQPDASRYDEALYGQLEAGEQIYQREAAYPDDPYAYQSDYAGDQEDEAPKRRGGMITVAAVLALAIVGTGGAFAYRTYMGPHHSGEPPIIRADNTPTKIMPAAPDAPAKTLDRMASADGTEKIVPREEAPIDINAKSGGPRVVFPPLNQNANPPPVASVAPGNVPPVSAAPAPTNGTLPITEPRKIRTLSVRGDQMDSGAPSVPPPATKPAAAPAPKTTAALHNPPSQANASANAPMSLAPQTAQPTAGTKMAAANPADLAPSAAPSGGVGYLVQLSAQRSEADAQASYRALQGKFPSVLGSRTPVIKRVDTGEKGIYYRAMVGPFASSDEAAQFCGSLKSAGGQCFVQRN